MSKVGNELPAKAASVSSPHCLAPFMVAARANTVTYDPAAKASNDHSGCNRTTGTLPRCCQIINEKAAVCERVPTHA